MQLLDLKSREAHTSYRFESGLRYNESPVVMRTIGLFKSTKSIV
jgi:hypothetical protein